MLSFCVVADNQRNNGSCATACKTTEKKEYIRHLWFAESSTFLDGRRWDEIEKSKQAPQTRTKKRKADRFPRLQFRRAYPVEYYESLLQRKSCLFTHLTRDMQSNFIYAEFRINCKAGRSYRVYSEIKKILDRDKSMKNQYRALFNLSFSLLNLTRDEYKYIIKYISYLNLYF